MNLYQAHHEWATRPPDERFASLADLYATVKARDEQSTETLAADVRSARVVPLDGGRLGLTDATLAVPRVFTNWSLGQLATRIDVPRNFLPKLSLGVTTDVLNDRLERCGQALPEASLLGWNGSPEPTLRALTSQRYERLWDSKVVGDTQARLPEGWRNPVAYKDGEFGADLVPSGLYASDRDLFMFLIDGGDQVDLGKDGEAHHGFIVWNSEVGAATFGWMAFYFEKVCGNNIIWGAHDVHQFKARHLRGIHDLFAAYQVFLGELRTQDHQGFALAVEAARAELAVKIEATDVATLSQAVPRFKKEGFGAGEVANALASIHQESRDATGSRWDWLQGFTAAARRISHVDARVDLEQRASKALLGVVRG